MIALLCLLWLSGGVSSPEVPALKITRNYPPCRDISKPKCIVVCSVSSVKNQAKISWFNGSISLSSLTISDLNNRLYLEVKNHDKNNYSCVLSSPGINLTTPLNIHQLCHLCSDTKPVPVSERDAVILPTNLTVQFEDHIMWFYGNSLIAELFKYIISYYDCKDKRFYNNLEVNNNTGSLTIKNTCKIHSGTYKLLIPEGQHQECLGYNVTVYDPLPSPVITKDSKQCASSSKCAVLCSVMNVTHVSLSWYNGSRLNSSISVSDPNSNFLCLEVKYQDTNNYSCMVNNSFTNKTTHLNVREICRAPSRISPVVCVVTGLLFCWVAI